MKYILLSFTIAFLLKAELTSQSLPLFLQGTWKMENKEIYEHWDILNEHSMKGFSYKIKDGKMVISEYLDITLKGDEIIYTASVLNQNEGKGINFKLIKSDTSFIFENPEHDFPKKIVYQKLSGTEIFVQVSDGGQKGFSYKMIKSEGKQTGSLDKKRISDEVSLMLHNYYLDVSKEGLLSEFEYLDDQPDFFWIPPGYFSPLNYESVKYEIEKNAVQFQSVQLSWDTLQIYPLSNEIANYNGIVKGEMTDTSGMKSGISLLESGTAINRGTGWKILSGHTSIRNNQSTNFLTNPESYQEMKKVTGIGGIFFKCKDPDKIKEWYKTHLGLETDQYGTNFEWRQSSAPAEKGFTQWSPFSEKTKYFEPSTKGFMINYRVANLEALIEELRKEGVTVLDEIATYEYGKFVHILDIEGNKIELWEPNDIEYDKIVEGRTK